MEQMSVNPTLIFFEKDMEEEHIQKVVDKLHGRHLNKKDSMKEFIVTMKQISDILTHGNPQIGLMFQSGRKISITKVPGYINVPHTFNP